MGEIRNTAHQSETALNELHEAVNSTVEGEISALKTTINLLAFVLTAALAFILGWIALGILRPIQTLAATMTQSANENDLNLRIQLAMQDEIGKTGIAFNSMLEKFQSIVGKVNGSAAQMSAAAEELFAITHETTAGI